MKPFLIALQFLTILPVKIKGGVKNSDFGRSLTFFPVIGLIIGMALALLWAISGFMPHLLQSGVILIASIILTGGLHIDGFADTSDGLYGNRPREKALEIMRDSHVGAMGVLGIVSILLLKFTTIAGMPDYLLWRALILMSVFSRYSQVFACTVSKYARNEGKARHFIEHAKKGSLLIGGAVSLAVFVFLAGFKGIVIFWACLFIIFLFISYIKKRIGGMTGDTTGAVSEVAEVSVLIASLLWL